MKKTLTKLSTATALMGIAADAKTTRIALVVKALSISFFAAANKSAEEAAKGLDDLRII
ncbi:hypothetical protein [Cypionkella sp.]|uniref:hypothetical protein n=1 Tax=Cypionkella sp. TaxID=2811411 RepID=UPI00275B087C|nr:hypothetical protein [Cypionkella sp.]